MPYLSPTLSPAPSTFSQPKLLSFYSIRCCAKQTETITLPNGSVDGFPEKRRAINTGLPRPPRPRRIILVRHGQSTGNVDESVYTMVADPKIALTEKGKAEAEERGKKIKEMIEKDGVHNWKVYFYVSPYRRTLETLQCLALPFERSRIAGMREEPRLREQDFGKQLIQNLLPFLCLEISRACLAPPE